MTFGGDDTLDGGAGDDTVVLDDHGGLDALEGRGGRDYFVILGNVDTEAQLLDFGGPDVLVLDSRLFGIDDGVALRAVTGAQIRAAVGSGQVVYDGGIAGDLTVRDRDADPFDYVIGIQGAVGLDAGNVMLF